MRAVTGFRCSITRTSPRPEEETYKAELEQLTESLQISQRVSFIGNRDGTETVLAASDIYCEPNETSEAFEMVFIEALYAAKPVESRALGGAQKILASRCGVRCQPGIGPMP